MPDTVLTLRDLESWSHPGVALAVVGDPIGHSLSPGMQNAALRELARTDARYASWHYYAFQIPVRDLPAALRLFWAKGFRGLNLTVPHKQVAFREAAAVDEAARPIGAVNTLRRAEGGWEGFNTDGHGLAAGIRQDLGMELAGAEVLLLGAGGAARGAAFACLRGRCASLTIANRSRAKLEDLLAAVRPQAGKTPLRGTGLDAVADDKEGWPGPTLVINATSLGLKAADPAPINLALWPGRAAVYDMVYNPPSTALLRQAESLGWPCANGLSMLAHQGAKALEIWTGAAASQTVPSMLAAIAAR